MHSSKVFQLVNHINQLLVGPTSPVSQLTLQLNIVLLLLMLETPMRGIDCGKLSWAHFFLPSQGQAPFPLGYCSSVLVKPNGTKTVKGQCSRPFTLTASQGAKHSCLPRLLIYLELLRSGRPCRIQIPVQTSLAQSQSFQDEPMTGSNFGQKFEQTLARCWRICWESNHGFRRSQIRRMMANRMSKAAIGEATQVKTLSIVGLYADVSRHIPHLEQLLKRPATASVTATGLQSVCISCVNDTCQDVGGWDNFVVTCCLAKLCAVLIENFHQDKQAFYNESSLRSNQS